MNIAVNWVLVIMSFLLGSRQANVWVLLTGTILTVTVWTVHVFLNNDGMNGMDCVCVNVYFHDRRARANHASGFISSNILDRLDVIFGSKFE